EAQRLSQRLAISELSDRSAIAAREAAEAGEKAGACKVIQGQLNSIHASQPCVEPSPSFRDRVLATNARLTESDRNRFSNALAEFEKSLTDGRDLFYKINAECGKIGNDIRSNAISNTFNSDKTTLADLEGEGWKYQKSFPQMRSKWQQAFNDQIEYIFGDNPDNQGPTALINAVSVHTGFLDAWKTVPKTSDARSDYFFSLANNEYQMRM